MTANARASDRGQPIGETVAFALIAAAFYGLTWQSALHGTDWRWFVLWLDEPGAVHPQHPGYLVVGHGLRGLLAMLELDAYGVLRVLSVLGGSVAVAGFARAANALCADRLFAGIVAVLVMLSPALWHHSTVVELHAPFAAVMAWATWAAVCWIRHRTLGWAIATGALCGVATLMHATGHLFVFVVAAAMAWRCRERGVRWLAVSIAAFGAAHAVLWSGLFFVIRASGNLPRSVQGFSARPGDLAAPDNPLDYLLRWLADMDFLPQLLPTLLNEWLLPFAPASVLLIAALFVGKWRAGAVLLVLVLCAYVFATVALVHAWTDERGAYLLPLLFPMTLLGLAIVPRRTWWLLVVSTLVCGGFFRGEPGRLPPDRAFGAAALAMATQQPTVFFVADFPEMDGAFRADPNMDLKLARKEHDELQAAQASVGAFDPTPEQVAGWLTLMVVEAKDKQARLVITDRAVAWMVQRVPAFAAGMEAFVVRMNAVRLPASAGIAGYVIP